MHQDERAAERGASRPHRRLVGAGVEASSFDIVHQVGASFHASPSDRCFISIYGEDRLWESAAERLHDGEEACEFGRGVDGRRPGASRFRAKVEDVRTLGEEFIRVGESGRFVMNLAAVRE
jgi:hypothetical protein